METLTQEQYIKQYHELVALLKEADIIHQLLVDKLEDVYSQC